MVANIISGSLIFATALLFGALGGMLSERAGVINLGGGGIDYFWGLLLRCRRQLSASLWAWAG